MFLIILKMYIGKDKRNNEVMSVTNVTYDVCYKRQMTDV